MALPRFRIDAGGILGRFTGLFSPKNESVATKLHFVIVQRFFLSELGFVGLKDDRIENRMALPRFRIDISDAV